MMTIKGELVAFSLSEGWIEINTHRAGIKRARFTQDRPARGARLGEEIIATVTDDWELVKITPD